MERGEEITREVLGQYNHDQGREIFSPEDIVIIAGMVATHDNAKIPLMLVGEYKDVPIPLLVKESCIPYLLQCGPKDWLMQLHWEADALWMLSSDGILVDLQRQKEEDTHENRLKKLFYNLGLHREIVEKVYQKIFTQDEVVVFGFHEQLLYRSKTGYQITQRLIAQGRAQWEHPVAVIPLSDTVFPHMLVSQQIVSAA